MTAVSAGNEEQRRVQELFDAQWENQDDQDLTVANEEKDSEKTKKLARDIRRARKDTILKANKSAEVDDDDEKASHFPNGYQEIPLAGGGIYRGYILGGAFHGQGELRFSNGDTYEGEFKKDMRDGHGKFFTKDQTVLRGQQISTVGEKKNFTLLRYEGPWVEDRREGPWGAAAYSNGDTYEGPFHANRPDTSCCPHLTGSALPSDDELAYYLKHGELPLPIEPAAVGTSTTSSDSPPVATSGELPRVNSTRKLPTYNFADGRVYIGEFKCYSREGRGAMRTKTGDVWVGTFSNGILHGKGAIKYAEAPTTNSKGQQPAGKMKRFVGTFRFGKRIDGRLTYTDGKIYDGNWDPETEKPHGKGSCKLRCGDIYVGEWCQGKMHGKGRITYTGANEGKYYDGEWTDDKPHGRGTMLMPIGVMVECLWEQGKQVQAVDQEAKISEWAAAIKADPSSSFAVSPVPLEDRIAAWKVPLNRKTGCTIDDLPSLDWFISSTDTENSARKTMKKAKKPVTTEDDGSDIDLDAVEDTLNAAPAKVRESRDEGGTWEHFAQVEQPAEEAGPSDNEHNAFLRALRQKGFVPELLGKATDYDSDKDEAEEKEKEQKAAAEASARKDTSWFTGQQTAASGAASTNNSSTAAPTAKQSSDATDNTHPEFEAAESNNNDCVTGGQALHRGWIEKYSIGKSLFGFGGWKRRYFTLLLLKSPIKGRPDSGALLYYADEDCNKHLGTVSLSVSLQPSEADPILHVNPTKTTHKKADRPDLDLVVEYTEEGKRFKLLLRTASAKDHDQWALYLSRIIKKRQ